MKPFNANRASCRKPTTIANRTRTAHQGRHCVADVPVALAPSSLRFFKKEPTRNICSFCGLVDFQQIVMQLRTKTSSAAQLVAGEAHCSKKPHFIFFLVGRPNVTSIECLQ